MSEKITITETDFNNLAIAYSYHGMMCGMSIFANKIKDIYTICLPKEKYEGAFRDFNSHMEKTFLAMKDAQKQFEESTGVELFGLPETLEELHEQVKGFEK